MTKLFENIKEFTYDAIGYILPGIVIMYLAIIVIGNHQSPMYVFFYNLKKYNDALNIITKMNIMFVIISSYIIGHLTVCISDFIGCLLGKIPNLEKFNDVLDKNRNKYIKKLQIAALEKYKDDEVLKLIENNEYKIDYLKTKASTLSRFESHSDLIQKYIYKSNLYRSLSCIFIILFFDSVISTFIKRSFLNIYNYVAIFAIVLLIYSLYKEYIKHKNLRLKESYMYLLKKEKPERGIG